MLWVHKRTVSMRHSFEHPKHTFKVMGRKYLQLYADKFWLFKPVVMTLVGPHCKKACLWGLGQRKVQSRDNTYIGGESRVHWNAFITWLWGAMGQNCGRSGQIDMSHNM